MLYFGPEIGFLVRRPFVGFLIAPYQFREPSRCNRVREYASALFGAIPNGRGDIRFLNDPMKFREPSRCNRVRIYALVSVVAILKEWGNIWLCNSGTVGGILGLGHVLHSGAGVTKSEERSLGCAPRGPG